MPFPAAVGSTARTDDISEDSTTMLRDVAVRAQITAVLLPTLSTAIDRKSLPLDLTTP